MEGRRRQTESNGKRERKQSIKEWSVTERERTKQIEGEKPVCNP